MAGAIKDADMERYLEIRITESGKVGEVLRAEAGLTKRQISQAKFRPGGILKNGKQCRVTEIAVPGDRLQVCLEAKGIDSKQLVCPDTGSFIEQGKKQLLAFERQEMEDGLKLQKLQILYEDQDLLVVNKPAGIFVKKMRQHAFGPLAVWIKRPPGFYFLPETRWRQPDCRSRGKKESCRRNIWRLQKDIYQKQLILYSGKKLLYHLPRIRKIP